MADTTAAEEAILLVQPGNSEFIPPSTMRYQIPGGSNFPQGSTVALVSAVVPFSWRNISAALGNNTIGYRWEGVLNVVAIPDGYYSIADLNLYLRFVMNANGHFLLDADANPVYYISIAENRVYYTTTLTAEVVPAVLPPGWTNPNTIVLSGLTQQLAVPAAIGVLFGFEPGTYPAAQSAVRYETNGALVPRVDSISAVTVAVSIADNRLQASRGIAVFVPTAAYGSYLRVEPSIPVHVRVVQSLVQTIDVTLLDQYGVPVPVIDRDISYALMFRIPR